MEISKYELEECSASINNCRREVAKRLVGQKEVIDGILTAMIGGGHILLEGVPGLAKTLAVRTFAEISGLEFKRIQFTPDLLPADVTGTLIYQQALAKFAVRRGPVFSNIVLADEINRAPAKVQSALLEAMAEHQVTIGETSYHLPEPFFVLATQNPIEQEGTYNLPEAEQDRFLMKLLVTYPTPEEEIQIVKSNGNAINQPVQNVFSVDQINRCKSAVEAITADDKIINYIVSIVSVTRPEPGKNERRASSSQKKNDILHYISYGASPRAGIALLQCAKVAALFNGRSFVLPEDVQAVAKPVLRHRLVLNYEASADSVSTDELISKIIEIMPLP
ncbi:MAG: MoxR family ATPase [Treponema sp.]|nr:MoxR family ATPase [Treponema sp.]MBR6193017.1 MoxR family ATPase [Treponema sp.]